ncbi:carbohydrate esterase family 4 protein [Mycena metata]|uniref:Carbohydrate esterase family 4 protein n=1 Tax=Mycena metata TaxID=1033252 RepID=A0AAD7ILY6_9AGAR|nr:carbohydrate esterase family 4 protein [Mycena metata]
MLFETVVLLLPFTLSLARPPPIIDDASPPRATVYSGCKVNNTVALTFDDGPYIHMNNISDMLTNASAKGTFFVNGHNYDCIYDKKVAARVQYAYEQGHQIAAHTWSHPDLSSLNMTEMADEFTKINDALLKVLGIKTPFMRPPYGSYNNLVRQVAYQMNQSLVVWDLDSGDSVGATLQESEGNYTMAIASRPANILALNHETVKTTAASLVPFAINALQNAGYQLVTVADCLGLDAYSYQADQVGTWDKSWFCPEDEDGDDN